MRAPLRRVQRSPRADSRTWTLIIIVVVRLACRGLHLDTATVCRAPLELVQGWKWQLGTSRCAPPRCTRVMACEMVLDCSKRPFLAVFCLLLVNFLSS